MSLFWWKIARKERREGENGRETLSLSFFSFTLSLAVRHKSLLCHSRFAFGSVRKTKHMRKRQEQSLFFLSPSSKTHKTRQWPRAWLKAALVSPVSQLRRSTLECTCTLHEIWRKRETARCLGIKNKWVKLLGLNKKDTYKILGLDFHRPLP